jgi:hypothetical protein
MKIFLLIIASLLVVGGGWFAYKSIPCKWRYSGIESRYRPFIGCQVNVSGDIWVPEDKYRGVE